jgi:hypothetical protein
MILSAFAVEMEMLAPTGFEQILADLKAKYEHGVFEYSGRTVKFRKIVAAHLSSRETKYGIYVIRKGCSNEVIYVGKAGTIRSEGQFKGQGIRGRLRNVRERDVPANAWFGRQVDCHGSLRIEYIVLPEKKLSPTFTEAYLLQAFLNDCGRLPALNKSL